MKTKFLIPLFFLVFAASAQEPNPIITAFPSLKIPASSRGLAMGDCGIASATENQQLYYNAAKSAFTKNFHQASVSYTPWLTAISEDTRFLNANYLANVSNTSSFGIAVSYLNLGNMSARDASGATIASYKGREYSVLTSYALQLGPAASLGVGLRFLASQPVQPADQNGFAATGKNIFSVDADISYYGFHEMDRNGSKLEWGAVISNLGPKVSLPGNDRKTFLPTNLGLGISYTNADPNTGDRFTFAMDINKLLVPTPGGKHPDAGVLHGLFSSFTDAKLREEIAEIRACVGLEYSFAEQFFLRAGLSLENRFKGNRKYIGFGAGYQGIVMDQSWGIDFHYLAPFGTVAAVSPFQNAFGLSLRFGIGNFD